MIPFIFSNLVTLWLLSNFQILFVGDSYTAGLGVKEEFSYPTLIEKKFQKDGLNVSVINGGVSGDTTAGGKRRIEWMLNQSKPNLVVLSLGGNDVLRGLPTKQTKENLVTMIKKVQKRKIPVAVLGIAAPHNVGKKYKNEFDSIFKEIKKETSVPVHFNYIAKVISRNDFILSDGLHPNQKGHQVLADEVYEFLKPLVKRNIHD